MCVPSRLPGREPRKSSVSGSFNFSIFTFCSFTVLHWRGSDLPQALMVPLTLVCLSMMRNLAQFRIPEGCFSLKSLHPVDFLVLIERTK